MESNVTHVIGVRCRDDFLTAIDRYRRELPDLPSRPEALRRLAAAALPIPKQGTSSNLKNGAEGAAA